MAETKKRSEEWQKGYEQGCRDCSRDDLGKNHFDLVAFQALIQTMIPEEERVFVKDSNMSKDSYPPKYCVVFDKATIDGETGTYVSIELYDHYRKD